MSFILVRLFCWFLIRTRRSAEKFVLPEASDQDTDVYLLIWFSSIVCFVVTDRFVSTAGFLCQIWLEAEALKFSCPFVYWIDLEIGSVILSR
jgi:hypothetical protein